MSKSGIKNLATAASLAALGAVSAAADTPPSASLPNTLSLPDDFSLPLYEEQIPFDANLSQFDQATAAHDLRFDTRVTEGEQHGAQRKNFISAFGLNSSVQPTDLHVATVDLFAPALRTIIEREIRRGHLSPVTTFSDLNESRTDFLIRAGQFSAPAGKETTVFGSLDAGVRISTIFSGSAVKGPQDVILPSPSSQVFGQRLEPVGSITLGARHVDSFAWGSRELFASATFAGPIGNPIKEMGFMNPRDSDLSVSVSVGLNLKF